MAKGFSGMPGMGGMGGMGGLMKQAQKMQKQMEEKKEELEARTIEVTAGGGVVKIVMSGKKQVKDIVLAKEVVDPDDIEMLQDLLISAINEAVSQADELMATEMGKITGGIGMPGLF